MQNKHLPYSYLIPVLSLFLTFVSCSHEYTSNNMDLAFYQWNFWTDEQAGENETAPSCGWDEMNRGVGKLIRIPATVGEYFSTDYTGVSWFHVRFTLPELWAERDISIKFEGVNGNMRIFLNEEMIQEYPHMNGPFSLDLTGKIFYTRDNHLVLRITDPHPGQGGVTGKIILQAASPEGETVPEE